jgi:hypothetical protein
MGMYTELVFQGEMIDILPWEVTDVFNYFFDEDGKFPFGEENLPDHPFFKAPSWYCVGYVSSYYWTPFSLRYKSDRYGFLRCDIKNYSDEIPLFLDWISPYMTQFYGYYWYEEDDKPTVFEKKWTETKWETKDD